MESAVLSVFNIGVILRLYPRGQNHYHRPLINKPSPLNRDDNRDPNIKALKRSCLIYHGSTFGPSKQKALDSKE